MKGIKLNIFILLLSLSVLTKAKVTKHFKRNRKLEDSDEAEVEDIETEEVADENPDLEMLKELENEANGKNIFNELMEKKADMIERLRLLELMVDQDMLISDDPEDPLNKKHLSNTEKKYTEPEENWVAAHRHRLIKVFILIIIIAFILLVGWKLSKISADLIKKKKAVKMFQQKLEEVDEKEIDSLVATWKDQREGISKFLDKVNFDRIHC